MNKYLMCVGAVFFSSLYASQDLVSCRAIIDNTARLACYDALVDSAKPVSNADGQSGAGTDVISNVVMTSTLTNLTTPPVAPNVEITDAVKSNQSSASSSTHNKDTFGLEQKIAKKEQLDEIETYIDGEFSGWQAKDLITLANGQVWQIADGSSGYYKVSSPRVRIERGVFGVFYMRFEGLNKAPKVKRIK